VRESSRPPIVHYGNYEAARFLEIYNKAAILDTVGCLYARWRSATCATRVRAAIFAKMKTDSGESHFRVRTKPLRKLRL